MHLIKQKGEESELSNVRMTKKHFEVPFFTRNLVFKCPLSKIFGVVGVP